MPVICHISTLPHLELKNTDHPASQKWLVSLWAHVAEIKAQIEIFRIPGTAKCMILAMLFHRTAPGPFKGGLWE